MHFVSQNVCLLVYHRLLFLSMLHGPAFASRSKWRRSMKYFPRFYCIAIGGLPEPANYLFDVWFYTNSANRALSELAAIFVALFVTPL